MIKEELMQDLKAAMKEKDSVKKDTVTMLRAAILQVEKDKQITLEDDAILEIVAKEVKKRKESRQEYISAERTDIVEKLDREIEILSKYLPKQLTISEIEELVKIAIQEEGATSPKDMGKVMKNIKPKVAAKADGKLVSEIVKKLLA